MLLDWRRDGADTVLGCSMVVRGAAEALRLVEGLARDARYGEYRITPIGIPPIYSTAPLIRAWHKGGGELPMPMSNSLWQRESQRASEIEVLTASLRSPLQAAARRGLIPQSTAAEIVRLVEAAADGGYDAGDVTHGPLSR